MNGQQVTIFARGDSFQPKVWSNVPFFLAHALKNKGIIVNRVNIGEQPALKKIHSIIHSLYKKTFGTEFQSYDYYRSNTHRWYAHQLIKRASRLYPGSIANIFFDFSISTTCENSIPSVHISDWPYEYVFGKLISHQPNREDIAVFAKEAEIISHASLVISIFPEAAQYMHNRFKRDVHYIGNGINSFDKLDIRQARSIIEEKLRNRKILFIGSRYYITGALALLSSFKILQRQLHDLELHIIGLREDELPTLPKNAYAYGYLDKSNENHLSLYRSLLKKSRLYVNTRPEWGAFQATIEAMYYFTPVIICPNGDITGSFRDIGMYGSLIDQNDSVSLADRMQALFMHENYEEIALNAHRAVSHLTWDSFAARLLDLINTL